MILGSNSTVKTPLTLLTLVTTETALHKLIVFKSMKRCDTLFLISYKPFVSKTNDYK